MFTSGDMTRHQDVSIGIPHGFCQRLLKTAKISSKIGNIWLFFVKSISGSTEIKVWKIWVQPNTNIVVVVVWLLTNDGGH